MKAMPRKKRNTKNDLSNSQRSGLTFPGQRKAPPTIRDDDDAQRRTYIVPRRWGSLYNYENACRYRDQSMSWVGERQLPAQDVRTLSEAEIVDEFFTETVDEGMLP